MRLTIKEAAERLDMPEQGLREWCKRGCPFGIVMHDAKRRNGRRTYYVNGERLQAYLDGADLMKGE